jgi:phosphatidylinositol-binding clathrin assembly protein
MAAPKSKYVENILTATRTGEAGVAEVFRTLSLRLRDTTWTIVFKSLIIVHLMIREGDSLVTLRFLAEYPSKMAISSFSDGMSPLRRVKGDQVLTPWTVQSQGANIRHYHNYLLSRAKSFKDTKIDWVREGKGRLSKQTVDKGLLRETESVQKQISALIRCEVCLSR